MKQNKQFFIFLGLHVALWSLLPILLRSNLPMDSAEALVWGFVGEWGTPKHPPLSGWLANMMYQITQAPASLYVLSQLCIAGGFVYVYRLAKEIFSADKALAASIILEGVAYYNLVTPEYNVNVVAMMLWPAVTYYFYKGQKENRLIDWILFGVFAGLNILNKYVSGVLLLALGLYLLFTKQGRTSLKSWKLYAGAIVAFALILPHVWWLYQHDWFVLNYFLSRSGNGKVLPFGLGHIVYPLKFVGGQILLLVAPLLVLATCRKKAPEKTTVPSKDRAFVFYAGVLPLLIMGGLSLLTGLKLKSMWGSPTLYLFGLVFMTYFPFHVHKLKWLIWGVGYVFMGLYALIFIGMMCCSTSAKYGLNAKDLTQALGTEKYDYVGGSVWLASTLSVYASHHPQVLFFMEPKQNPWINMEDVKQKGILVVEEELSTYQWHQEKIKNLPEPKIYDLVIKTQFGKEVHYPLYYGEIVGDQK